MIDLGQLEAFVQVAEQSSFSRAGEILFLTQPTISARIQTLERDVGEPLFDRSGRAVRLTESGKTFLPYARRVIETVRGGIAAVDALRKVSAGRLELGSARVIGTYVLPTVLRIFHDTFPGVTVSIRTGRSADVLDMVLSGEVELGFTRNLVHPEIETVHIFDEPLVLVVAPDHPLAQKSIVSIRDVAREPLILYHRDSTYYSVILGICRDAGINPDVVMELDNIEATKRMIVRGLGISILPRSSLEDEVAHGSISAIALAESQALRLPVCAIYRRRNQLGYLVEAFINVIRDVYPSGDEAEPR